MAENVNAPEKEKEEEATLSPQEEAYLDEQYLNEVEAQQSFQPTEGELGMRTDAPVTPSTRLPLIEAANNHTGTTSLDQVVDTARAEMESQRHTLGMMELSDPTRPADERVQRARDLLAKPLPPISYGEARAKLMLPTADLRTQEEYANGMEIATIQEPVQQHIMQNLGDDPNQSYESFLSQKREEARLLMEGLKELGPVPPEVTAAVERDDGWSYLDVLEFIDPVPYEDSIELDFMDYVTNFFTDERDLPDFSETMESKYGENWAWRWTAFLAKEVAIDAAILGTAFLIPPLSAALFATKGISIGARIAKASARAGLVAGGGAGAQQYITEQLGGQSDFTDEFVMRFVGYLGGEALATGVSAGVRSLRGAGRSVLGDGAKPMTPEQVSEVLKRPGFNTTYGDTAYRASLRKVSQDYKDIAEQHAQGVLKNTAEMDDVRDELATTAAALFNRDRSAITDLDAIADVILKEVPEEFQDEIGNQILRGNAIGLRAMGRSINGLRDDINNFNAYLDKDGLKLRGEDWTVDATGMQKLLSKGGLAEPEVVVGRGGDDILDVDNAISRTTAGITRRFNNIMKGTSRKQRGQLMKAMMEGDSQTTVWSRGELSGKFGLDNKALQDAYYDIRGLMDESFALRDSVEVRDFARRGYKEYQGDKWKVLKEVPEKPGYVRVKKLDSDTVKTVKKTELNDITSVLEYRTGYVPRQYNDRKYFVLTMNKKGEMSRVGVFGSAVDAKRFETEMRGVVDQNSSVMTISNSHGMSTTSVHTNQRGVDLFNSMDKDSAEKLKAAFEELDLDVSNVRAIFNRMDGTSLKRDFVGPRSDVGLAGKGSAQLRVELERLRTARKNAKTDDEKAALTRDINEAERRFRSVRDDKDLVKTDQSIVEYLSSMAAHANSADWRFHYVEQFKRNYADILDKDVLTGRRRWDDDDVFKRVAGKERMVAEAKAHQSFLRRHIKGTTKYEKWFDNVMTRHATVLAEGNAAARAFSKLIDSMPSAVQMNNALRGIGSVPKLMAFAIPQILVQASQVAATAGANPRLAARATTLFPMMGALASRARIMGVSIDDVMKDTAIVSRMPKKAREEAQSILKSMERSGYFDDITTNDLMQVTRTSDYHPAMKAMNHVVKVGATPFRIGEATNRSFAFVTSHMKVRNDLASGTLRGLDGKTLPKMEMGTKEFNAFVDSDEFTRLVVHRAKNLALNMGKAGQLQLLSGFGSSTLQFKQVLPKMINMFSTKNLTKRERLGAGAAMFGMWGVGGIPLVLDIMYGADKIVSLASGEPSDTKFFTNKAENFTNWAAEYISDMTADELGEVGLKKETITRFLKDGAIAALSDNEINITNRVALGRFVTDAIQSADMSWMDAMVSLSVMEDLYDFADKLGPDILTLPTFFYIMSKVAGVSGYGSAATAGAAAVGVAIKDIFEDEGDANLLKEAGVFDLLGNEEAERTFGEATLAASRELGQAFSYLGSVTRLIESRHPELADSDYYSNDLFRKRFFMTSNRNTTPVEVTPARTLQLAFGITPGKLVEHYSKQSEARMYKQAYQDYKQRKLRDIRQASLGSRTRIIQDALEELKRFEQIIHHRRLDIGLPQNIAGSFLSAATREMAKTYQPSTPLIEVE